LKRWPEFAKLLIRGAPPRTIVLEEKSFDVANRYDAAVAAGDEEIVR
jgi:hypothetical protein